ncbi:MAG: hypothetical protein AAGJ39_14140, partial [Pseudomonadota bacterium]
MHAYRSQTCAELTAANVGQTVRLSGWVHRVRDHGGVLFIDLRNLREHRAVRVTQHLGDAVVVAQVDEQHPAMVA